MSAKNAKFLVLPVPGMMAYGIYENSLLSKDAATPADELSKVAPFCTFDYCTPVERKHAKNRAEYVRILLENDEKEFASTIS